MIQKKPSGQEQAIPYKGEGRGKAEPAIEETAQGESFNLFADKGDESLVRPSDLFKDRQDMFIGAPEKDVESKQALHSREKSQKIAPGERLVRPSEYLGQMQENVAVEGNASDLAGSPENAPDESQAPGIESSASPGSPVQEDLNAGRHQQLKKRRLKHQDPRLKFIKCQRHQQPRPRGQNPGHVKAR